MVTEHDIKKSKSDEYGDSNIKIKSVTNLSIF